MHPILKCFYRWFSFKKLQDWWSIIDISVKDSALNTLFIEFKDALQRNWSNHNVSEVSALSQGTYNESWCTNIKESGITNVIIIHSVLKDINKDNTWQWLYFLFIRLEVFIRQCLKSWVFIPSSISERTDFLIGNYFDKRLKSFFIFIQPLKHGAFLLLSVLYNTKWISLCFNAKLFTFKSMTLDFNP